MKVLLWSFCSCKIAQPCRMWEWEEDGRPEREIEIQKTGSSFHVGKLQWCLWSVTYQRHWQASTWEEGKAASRVQTLNTDHHHQSAPRGGNCSLQCNTGHKLPPPRTKYIITMAHSALPKDHNPVSQRAKYTPAESFAWPKVVFCLLREK